MGRRRTFGQSIKPYLFLAPILLFAVGFVYYPFLKTLLFSVSTVNARGGITAFAGLENFAYLFSRREFSAALQNTVRLTALNVPVTLVLTLWMAYLCDRKRPLSGVYETLFTLPMAVAMSSVALVFKVLFNPTVGMVNWFLGVECGWLTEKSTALSVILLLTVWMGLGFNFLLFLSAFRGIPVPLIEAAQLDGAGRWSILWRIQLPLLSPTILYVVCTNTVQALMTSGPVLILTQGGPSRSTTTLIYMMYTSGYASSNYGLAACLSLVTFGLAFVFTALMLRLDERKVAA